MKTLKEIPVILVALIIITSGCQQRITPEEAKEIAKEAYIYGFPMVVNYKTMYMYVVDENSLEYKGGFNFLGCEARVFTPDDKAIVTPNSDTPYCMFWLDLRSEPFVIRIPEMEPERFFHFQFIDAYTHNFAYVGTLTTGNEGGTFLIAGPGWSGEVPEGITEVIQSESDVAFIIVRTQLFGPEDLENVKNIQEAYTLEPLSAYAGTEAPPEAPALEFPVWHEGDQFTMEAFKYLDFMLTFIDPVEEEKALMKRFAKIDVGPGEQFDINNFSPEIQEAINSGVEEGFTEIEDFIRLHTIDPLASAKIFGTREFLTLSALENYNLEHHYLIRACAAHIGLFGNSGEEAIYPTYLIDNTGNPPNAAESNYTMTFAEGELPPVKAFWSLTMYDGTNQLLVPNQLDRYLLNSPMMDQFVIGKDGSLTLYIQKKSPGKKLESNWLPAPDGPFYMVLRLYGPQENALSGEWVNPPMVKAD